MTREGVFAAVRRALGRDPGGSFAPQGAPAAGFPARSFAGDPLARFVAELAALSGEAVQATDVTAAVLQLARAWACHSVFAAPDVEVAATGLPQVAREVAMRDPERVLGVARAAWGIAESGSVVIETPGGHLPSALTASSVVLLDPDRIVWGLEDVPPVAAATRCRVIVAGPSRTADIEKRIVLGAHGPRRLAVVLHRR